ncbi:metallophosphatase domain-containing protein [Parasphingorhabdus sp.]|uniref:metallophosphatase domain-containing protein n=1 Tax=Parasphingorhabdus sp. TaxID=2709688 RepID=UPI0035940C3E
MPVRIVVISDTHLRHRELRLPKGDLLIHCGDLFTLQSRDRSLVTDLDDWFGAQDFDQIVCIGGNHDHILQDIAHREPQPFANAHYLQDTTFRYAGLNIHGSPWVPDLPYHAYDRDGAELANTWARIPDNSDILITHVPPAGRLDQSSQGHSHGCPLLAAELPRIAPKVHCFGHVHASGGSETEDGTVFINACSIDGWGAPLRQPISIPLEAGS